MTDIERLIGQTVSIGITDCCRVYGPLKKERHLYTVEVCHRNSVGDELGSAYVEFQENEIASIEGHTVELLR